MCFEILTNLFDEFRNSVDYNYLADYIKQLRYKSASIQYLNSLIYAHYDLISFRNIHILKLWIHEWDSACCLDSVFRFLSLEAETKEDSDCPTTTAEATTNSNSFVTYRISLM